MKTFEEIRSEITSDISIATMMGVKEKKVSFADVEKAAAKEYAKQWVEEAVFWAAMQSESGLPIIDGVLPRIQKRIDAQ